MANQKLYTKKEVQELADGRKEVCFIIDNNVYSVTKFIDEHPGGHEVLLNVSGKDASEDFADVGHSLDAKELMVKFKVGELVESERVEVKKRTYNWNAQQNTTGSVDSESSFMSSWKFPVVLGILVTVLYTYLFA